MSHSHIVSIDPGVQTGVVLWQAKGFGERFAWPVTATICKPGRGLTWKQKCDSTLRDLQEVLGSVVLEESFIEFPHFIDTAGGHTAARSGSLVKLSYMCGRLHQQLANFRSRVRCVRVTKWKGQLSKEATNRRILEILSKQSGLSVGKVKLKLQSIGFSRNMSHDWDALGIGLWAQDMFPG